MIARTEIDKCFSTALNGHGAFNFDNEERTELSPELARSVLDFTISVKKCYDDTGREIPSLRHLQDNEGHFIPCHGVTDSFHSIQHVDVFDYIVNYVMPKVPELELEMAGTIRGRSMRSSTSSSRTGTTSSTPTSIRRAGEDTTRAGRPKRPSARVSLNRPCGNGMPNAGAIGRQEVLGLRI